MTIYCDLDGTLTHAQNGPKPWLLWPENIAAIKRLISHGASIVLWSARGEDVCKEFAKEHGIKVKACLPKPTWCFDDTPSITRPDRMKPIHPDDIVDWVERKYGDH